MAVKPAITVVCVGRRAEPWVERGVSHYCSLCRPWCSLSVVRLRDHNDEPEKTRVHKETAGAIDVLSRHDGKKVLLDVRAGGRDSAGFASFIAGAAQANGKLLFLIGGINGFSEEVRKHVNAAVSLSQLTFNHHVALLVLAEQIYRAFSIAHHTAYHR
jgi:23S rRNA (pseudouridine1915-N3)-methyltransferase